MSATWERNREKNRYEILVFSLDGLKVKPFPFPLPSRDAGHRASKWKIKCHSAQSEFNERQIYRSGGGKVRTVSARTCMHVAGLFFLISFIDPSAI